MSWKNLSLGNKFLIQQIIVFIIILVPFMIFIDTMMTNHTEKQLNYRLHQIDRIINENFQLFANHVLDETNKSYNIFETILERYKGQKLPIHLCAKIQS